MTKKNHELIKYLKTFISEDRYKLFKKKIDERTQHITVVLEDIFQSRNIAASIRSADCFGIQNVHIIENQNIFQDDTEVSLGASKWIDINRYNQKKENTVNAITKLQKKGYQIIATTPHNADIELFDLDISKKKTAIIFGSEINGCSENALKLADQKMTIPMYGFSESFNISVSVSLCLQHLVYKMRKSKIDWKINKKEQNEIVLRRLKNSLKSSTRIEARYLENL